MTTLQKRAVYLLVAGLTGAITAKWQYSPQQYDPKTNTANEWTPPGLPDFSENQAAFQKLTDYYRSNPQLGGLQSSQAGSALPKASSQEWILHGIVEQYSKKYALIKAGTKVTRYPLYGQLPDASTIVEIDPNSITIDTPDGTQTIILHPLHR